MYHQQIRSPVGITAMQCYMSVYSRTMQCYVSVICTTTVHFNANAIKTVKHEAFTTEAFVGSRDNQTTTHTHTRIRLTALSPGLPRWAGTRKVKPIWILLKQETLSGSGISWTICKSAPCSRQTTPPLCFYRPDAIPAAQPTASKHWRQDNQTTTGRKNITDVGEPQS